MQHIGGNLYAEFIAPGCNVGIVATERGTFLSDTPLVRRQAERIARELAEAGRPPVRFIHYTDHHHDHALGGGLFGPDVLIFSSKLAQMGLEAWDPAVVADWVGTWHWPHPEDTREIVQARPPLPHVCFQGELELWLGGARVVLIPLPGHCPATCGVYLPEDGVLFSGDAVFHENHPYMGQANIAIWRETLDRILSLSVETILPGHGPLCGKGPVRKLREYLESVAALGEQWDPASGWEGAPADVRAEVDRLLSQYPLHGRNRDLMRQRIVEGLAVSREPRF